MIQVSPRVHLTAGLCSLADSDLVRVLRENIVHIGNAQDRRLRLDHWELAIARLYVDLTKSTEYPYTCEVTVEQRDEYELTIRLTMDGAPVRYEDGRIIAAYQLEVV